MNSHNEEVKMLSSQVGVIKAFLLQIHISPMGTLTGLFILTEVRVYG